MVGYDFDKTIYNGDCTINFFFYMIFSHIYLLIFLPWFLIVFLIYGVKLIDKKKMKELIFFFTPWYASKLEKILEKFWNRNSKKIFDWYYNQKMEDDVIVSASLKFIVEPMAKKLNVKKLIATDYDIKTGKINGLNCYGKSKVEKFNEIFPNTTLEAFYSDSLSDLPMMKISNEAFLVDHNNITNITEKCKKEMN